MNTPWKKWILVSSLCGFSAGLLGAFLITFNQEHSLFLTADSSTPSRSAAYKNQAGLVPGFQEASAKTTPAVVFIKTLSNTQIQQNPQDDWFNMFDFFGRRGPVASSGSGVIISTDGYIVTNNHVIKGADHIEVILNNNKHSFQATVVGTDPNSDLALLKIDARKTKLSAITFGNSDMVEVGDWVLAVGNPFNLTSTVTAGIVSAKGRNINLVNSQFPIESFIQTDAAINPGNSGGALVNTNGELVGINTAIQSNTGSYAGYGFAIPVNIVAKIVKDLIEMGQVQRGFTGMDVKDIDAVLADDLNYDDPEGIYVNQVMEDGPAASAGLKEGDILIKVDGKGISSKASFDEQLSFHRPGDKIKLTYLRKGAPAETVLTLINEDGNTKIARKYTYTSPTLNADFTPLTKMERQKFGVDYGIRVTNIKRGRVSNMGINEGTIILRFNGRTYTDAKDLAADIEKARGHISIEAIGPDGGRYNYSFFGGF